MEEAIREFFQAYARRFEAALDASDDSGPKIFAYVSGDEQKALRDHGLT